MLYACVLVYVTTELQAQEPQAPLLEAGLPWSLEPSYLGSNSPSATYWVEDLVHNNLVMPQLFAVTIQVAGRS